MRIGEVRGVNLQTGGEEEDKKKRDRLRRSEGIAKSLKFTFCNKMTARTLRPRTQFADFNCDLSRSPSRLRSAVAGERGERDRGGAGHVETLNLARVKLHAANFNT